MKLFKCSKCLQDGEHEYPYGVYGKLPSMTFDFYRFKDGSWYGAFHDLEDDVIEADEIINPKCSTCDSPITLIEVTQDNCQHDWKESDISLTRICTICHLEQRGQIIWPTK